MIDDLIDAAEELATRLPAVAVAAELERRARELGPGAADRAGWLELAGERWQRAGDLARARACFEEAIADGGETLVDPRAELLDLLLDSGETARAEDLLVELRQDPAGGQPRGAVHEYVGETLEEHGRLEEALRWYDSGLAHPVREAAESGDIGCLNGHYRVRRQLGLPHDRYDQECEQARRAYGERWEDEERLAAAEAHGRSRDVRSLVVLYWPPEDFAAAITRWPAMADEYGSEHREHRSAVERTLRGLAEQGATASVGPCHLAELLSFAEGQGDPVAHPGTRAAFAAHLGRLGSVVAWPPGRNDACWCGSGTTYKRCCGTFRF